MNHTGTFEVELRLPTGVGAGAAAESLAVVETFCQAVRLGMFPPGSISASALSPTDLRPSFRGADIPGYAFGVLDGMLAYHSQVTQPLEGWRVGPNGQDLCALRDPPPALPDPLPPFADIQIHVQKITEPLSVVIDTGRSLDSPTSGQLVAGLRVWHRLLQGGYPAPDFGRGESGTSPPSIGPRGRTAVQYSVEMWSSSLDAFVPLLQLVSRWRAGGLPTSTLEVHT